MRTTLLILVSSFIFSCNLSSNNCKELEFKNIVLQQKIDSLENQNLTLSNQSQLNQPKNKKKLRLKKVTNESYSTSITPARNPSKKYSTQSRNSYSNQCMATTRKGTRCSRTARSGGYCWQHGG